MASSILGGRRSPPRPPAPAAPRPGDHRAQRARTTSPAARPCSAGTPWAPDPVPATQDVEVLLAAAGEPHVVALGVAVVAQVHQRTPSTRPGGASRRPAGRSPRGGRTGRRGRPRRRGRPPAPGGIHQAASFASGICGIARREADLLRLGHGVLRRHRRVDAVRQVERHRRVRAGRPGGTPRAPCRSRRRRRTTPRRTRGRARPTTTARPISTHFLRDEPACIRAHGAQPLNAVPARPREPAPRSNRSPVLSVLTPHAVRC